MNPYNAYSRAQELVDETDKQHVLVKVFSVLPDMIERVKVDIAQKHYESKYQELSRITRILEVLNQSLDMSCGEIPDQLSELYGYLIKRLRSVHVSLDIAVLDECKKILGNMAEGLAQAYERSKRSVAPPPSTSAIRERVYLSSQV